MATEIKAGLGDYTFKQKLIFAVVIGSLHAFLLWTLDQFIDGDFQTPLGLLFQGVFFGLIMGFGFPFALKRFPKRFVKKLGNVEPDLEENEVVEVHGPVNLFRGMEGVGGKLFLTHKNLIFKSHKINIQTGQTIIPFTDISSIEKRKSGFIMNNGIRIHTKAGKKYDLVVGNRSQWMGEIKKRLS